MKRNQTTQDIILRFKDRHGDRYDYSDVVYTSYYEKVKIICKIHGMFMQASHHHYEGRGCPMCAKSGVKLNKNRVISDFRKVHGDEFIYDRFTYKNDYTKSVVTCREHGDFLITPNSHKNGTKCPDCFMERCGFGKSKFINCAKRHKGKATLYIMKLSSEDECFYKIGITTDLNKRFIRSGTGYRNELIKTIVGESSIIWEMEKEIHRKLYSHRYKPKLKFNGHTESFSIDSLSIAIGFINIESDKEITQGYQDD